MNLLARTARDLRRLWSADLGFTLGVALVGAAVEVVGRQTAYDGYDLHDLILMTAVFVATFVVVLRHRRAPLPWVSATSAAARRAGAWFRGGTFEIGLDLRGDPPVRKGVPPIVRWLGVGFAAWAALAALIA